MDKEWALITPTGRPVRSPSPHLQPLRHPTTIQLKTTHSWEKYPLWRVSKNRLLRLDNEEGSRHLEGAETAATAAVSPTVEGEEVGRVDSEVGRVDSEVGRVASEVVEAVAILIKQTGKEDIGKEISDKVVVAHQHFAALTRTLRRPHRPRVQWLSKLSLTSCERCWHVYKKWGEEEGFLDWEENTQFTLFFSLSDTVRDCRKLVKFRS